MTGASPLAALGLLAVVASERRRSEISRGHTAAGHVGLELMLRVDEEAADRYDLIAPHEPIEHLRVQSPCQTISTVRRAYSPGAPCTYTTCSFPSSMIDTFGMVRSGPAAPHSDCGSRARYRPRRGRTAFKTGLRRVNERPNEWRRPKRRRRDSMR